MEQIFDRDYDYIDEDDSGTDNNESSEDEIDILLQGTPERKLKLSRRRASSGEAHPDEGEDSEDDFEKEMNKELDDQVAVLEAQQKSLTAEGTSSNIQNSTQKEENSEEGQAVYDEVYFDSDEEEMVEGERRNRKQKQVMSNDELLYDPDMDDDDQRWMDNRRQRYQPSHGLMSGQSKPGQSTHSSKKKRLPNSDAVLDCPACMTTLCLDCQRHALYTNQYRAMFVSHCTVDLQEVLKYPKETPGKKRKKKTKFTETDVPTNEGQMDNMGDSTEYDVYHPVRCSECNTLVAMFDKEEIYHFFNVLSSYS